MKEVTNIKDMDKESIAHDIKISVKALLRLCEKYNVPIFISYYTNKDGYSYQGLFPEEIEDDSFRSQYGRFPKFLETVVGFNKEDYKPVISKNKS